MLALGFALPGVARALEPPRPGELAAYRADGSLQERLARARRLGNNDVVPGMLRAAVQRAQRAELGTLLQTPPPAWKGMPTTGTVNVLALPISFSDYPPMTSQEELQSKLFGAGDSSAFPYESVHAYYERSSYGKLDIEGDVLPWYDTGRPRATVGTGDASRESLIKQALQAYAATHPGWDATKYDNDGDGVIDYLIVLWTGPNTGWSGFWWGYQTVFGGYQDDLQAAIGERVGTYSWQWEVRYARTPPSHPAYDPLVTIHETGHALGLPDYYDYDTSVGPSGGVGGLDMMDDNWGDHNAFSKWLLDWLTPQAVTGGYGAFTLGASGIAPDALVAMPGAGSDTPFREYFLIENKDRAGNNITMPTDGLVIWHVDARLDANGWDYRFDNSFTPHKLLRLMEADGLEQISSNGWADAGDFYTAGDRFSPVTRPSSYAYGSTSRAILVRDISAPGPSMSLSAATDVAPPVTSVSGLPAGWSRRPVTLGFAASDVGTGVALTRSRVDGGAWTEGSSLTLPADPVTHAGDGVHTVVYQSQDLAGNYEQAHTVKVRIDTTGPVCRAPRAATVTHGGLLTLVYAVDDALSPRVNVTIRITGRDGRKVKTVEASSVLPGHSHTRSFTCRLSPGAYRFTVSARDLAGNRQVSVGSNSLRVR